MALLAGRVTANVMSVDLGSDSMKIAIVQPGMPMEIGGLIYNICIYN